MDHLFELCFFPALLHPLSYFIKTWNLTEIFFLAEPCLVKLSEIVLTFANIWLESKLFNSLLKFNVSCCLVSLRDSLYHGFLIEVYAFIFPFFFLFLVVSLVLSCSVERISIRNWSCCVVVSLVFSDFGLESAFCNFFIFSLLLHSVSPLFFLL